MRGCVWVSLLGQEQRLTNAGPVVTLGAVGASLRRWRRLSALLVCGVALSGVFQPSPTGPGDPAVAGVAPLAPAYEELACFLSPWGPCGREKLIYSPSFSEQHPARAWRSAPRPSTPWSTAVSDLGLCEAVLRLGLGGCGDPQVPGIPVGRRCPSFRQHESSGCFTGHSWPFMAQPLRRWLHAKEGRGGQRESSLCRVPGAGVGPATPLGAWVWPRLPKALKVATARQAGRCHKTRAPLCCKQRVSCSVVSASL